MDDLIAFLRARFDEREAALRLRDSDVTYELADLESKRQIVDLCVYMLWEYEGRGPDPVAVGTLRLLTLPYAKHPDYLEEWKP
jgi:hypothetical protein